MSKKIKKENVHFWPKMENTTLCGVANPKEFTCYAAALEVVTCPQCRKMFKLRMKVHTKG